MRDEKRVEMSCAPQPKPVAEHEARPMAVMKSTCMHRVAASKYTDSQPLLHMVAASAAHGCSLWCTWLQPLVHMVAASDGW